MNNVILVWLQVPAMRAAVCESLARCDWQPIEAASLTEAVALVAVDAVVTDSVSLLENFRRAAPLAVRVLVEVRRDASSEELRAALEHAGPMRTLFQPCDAAAIHACLKEQLADRPVQAAERRSLQALRARRAERQQQDQENPDLVTDGFSYRAKPSPRLADWLAGGAARFSPEPPSTPRLLDDVLIYLLRRPRSLIRLERGGAESTLRASSELGTLTLATLTNEQSARLVRRLYRLCNLIPDGTATQLGEVLVTDEGRSARLVARFCTQGPGYVVELERWVDWQAVDEATVGAPPHTREYRFLAKTSEDGISLTYRALEVALERHVTMRVLRQSANGDPDSATRMLRQARAEARIAHAGILQLLDYGQLPDGRPFVAHELVEWESLGARLNHGVLSSQEAAALLERLLRTLVQAHDADVVHRGLQPTCIWISDDGDTKIGNFGVARLLFDRGRGPKLTVANQVFGDPRYVAPEQLGTGLVDGRTDVYALACIGWQMITGRPPFDSDDDFEVLAAQRAAPPRAATPPRDGLGKALLAIFDEWLVKAPSIRPTAVEAHAQLQQLFAQGRSA